MDQARRLSFNDVAKFIETLTPEQREMDAMWAGEGRGGYIYETVVLTDDQINPSGDGWEDRGQYLQAAAAEGTDEERKATTEPIVARKGQPFFGVDAW